MCGARSVRYTGTVSETGERGTAPADYIERADPGGGPVPGDVSDSELQELELEEERETWGDAGASAHEPG